MTDNHYNEQLGSVFGDNELLCGITRAGIDAVAGQVVKVLVKRSTGVDWVWIKVVGQQLHHKYGQNKGHSQDKGQLRQLPGHDGSGEIRGEVTDTGGQGLMLNRSPKAKSWLDGVGGIPEGATVTIMCRTDGGRGVSTGKGGSRWCRVAYQGVEGWAAGAHLDPVKSVPSC
jgi:hypothetical protein